MDLIRLSWNEYDRMVRQIVEYVRLDDFHPELVIGIARGGLPLIASVANSCSIRETGVIFVQTTATDEQFSDRLSEVAFYGIGIPFPIKGKSVLLLDDIIRSGKSIVQSVKALKNLEAGAIKVVTLYKQKGFNDFEHHSIAEVEEDDWVIFPWNGV